MLNSVLQDIGAPLADNAVQIPFGQERPLMRLAPRLP